MVARTTNLDALIASVPINKDAGMAVGQSGEHYEPDIGEVRAHHETPPPTLPVPAVAAHMIGHRCGRLTVVGFLGSPNPKKNAKWLVRCVCGRYEERKHRALMNEINRTQDCCTRCQVERGLKRAEYRRRTGKTPPEDFAR